MTTPYWASTLTRPANWPKPAEMRDAAAGYAALGLLVAPTMLIRGKGWYGKCFTRRRQTTCDLSWDHPSEGFADKASRDPNQFQAWWPDSWNPETGIKLGIATGRESGIVGLEVIQHDGGIDSLEALEKRHGPLPETAVVASIRGDRRFLFRLRDGPVPSVPRAIARGIYVLLDDGLVYAPPSVSIRSAPSWLWTPAQGIAPAPAYVIPPTQLPVPPPPGAVLTGAALEGAASDSLKAAAAQAPALDQAPCPGPSKSTAYGMAALQREAATVRLCGAIDGTAARLAAERLWRLVPQGHVALHDLEHELLVAGRDAGLADPVTLKAIADGLRAGPLRAAPKKTRRRNR